MTSHSDPIGPVLFWVSLILFFALVGRYLAKRAQQPAVLGELIIGILIGNIAYYFGLQLVIILREGPVVFDIVREILAGIGLSSAIHAHIPNSFYAEQIKTILEGASSLELIKLSVILNVFSHYGVIFLLFMVGLDSSIKELKRTGRASIQVALLGILIPIILGFVVAYFFIPHSSYKENLFVAATLAATSVGITARVFAEMKQLNTREAKTILGAAVIDDILGLIILSLVSVLITKDYIDFKLIVQIVISALVFFVLILSLGPLLLRYIAVFFNYFLSQWEVKLFTSFLFLMLLAWFATVMNLAAIIGAFCAGLILHDGYFSEGKARIGLSSIKNLLAPLEALFAPLFFILIGIQVKLEVFFHWQVLYIAFGLLLAAIVGKLLSGLGGNAKDDRLLIGIGMLPRGEVGLVFTSIGTSLGVISDEVFAAIVLMIMVTTLIVPPLLKLRYKQLARTHK